MPITVEPLTGDSLPAVVRLLETHGCLEEGAPNRGYWLAVTADPFRIHSDVLIGRVDGAVAGLALVMRRPFGAGAGGGRCVFGWVAPDRRRLGVGRALKAGVDHRLAALGVGQQVASLLPGVEGGRLFLEALGFTHLATDLVMGAVGKPYSYAPVPGLRAALYTGGDPSLDAAIAELLNRAFRSDPMIEPTTAAKVAHLMAVEKTWMMLAIEEGTEAVVGATECTDGTAFISIAVARRYWGKGVADWIAGLSLDRYRDAGTSPWALVRAENQASIALMTRVNWEQIGTCAFYASPVSAGAAD